MLGVCMDGWVCVWMVECVYGWLSVCMDGWVCVWMVGCVHGWLGVWMGGWGSLHILVTLADMNLQEPESS